MFYRKILLPALVFVLVLAGFTLGKAVDAAISSPGGQTDPLVTKSYVDGEVTKLQTQIDALKAEVAKLKGAK